MEKVIIYKLEDMKRAVSIINLLHINGIDNIRMLSELSDILDSGKYGSYEEEKREDAINVMEHKTVQPDKLEK